MATGAKGRIVPETAYLLDQRHRGDHGARRGALRPDRGRRRRRRERPRHRLVGPAAMLRDSGLPARDLGGRLVTPALDRLPHPHRLRRRPCPRVRDAPRGRQLRRDRPRRRRHRLDRPRHPRRRRRRPARRRPAPRRCARSPRASPRSRSSPATASTARPSCACCAPPASIGRGAAGPRPHQLPRRPRRPPECMDRRRLHRRRLHPHPRRRPRRGAGRRGRRLLRRHRLLARPGRARVRRRAPTSACRSSSTPSSSRTSAAPASPRATAALSADHLEYLDAEGVARHGRRRHRRRAPARRLLHPARDPGPADRRPPRRHGVPMAVATDCNPGSSPLTSLLLAMNMACTLFRLTPEEALAGATRNAARALGLDRLRHASPPASAPISRSGTSRTRPSSPTASASTRSTRASSRARTCSTLTPGSVTLAAARNRPGAATAPAALDPAARAGGRDRRPPRRRGGRRRPRRSTASTPASASSRASRSRAPTPPALQRNLILSPLRRRRRAHAAPPSSA